MAGAVRRPFDGGAVVSSSGGIDAQLFRDPGDHVVLPAAHLLCADPEETALPGGIGGGLRRRDEPRAERGRFLRGRLRDEDVVRLAELVEDLLSGHGALRLEAGHHVLAVLRMRQGVLRDGDQELFVAVRRAQRPLGGHDLFRELDRTAGIRERDRESGDHRSPEQHGPLVVGVVALVRHPLIPSAILADLMSTPETVTLRDVIDADLPVFFEFERDPVANEMAAFPARDREAFMEHWKTNILGNDTGRKRTILRDGDVVGNILSWQQSGDTLVGYWVGREHWGRGVASRALALFLLEVDERPLHAHVAAHNAGSIRVLEKCGFRVVGEQTIDESGTRIDEVILRLEADPDDRRDLGGERPGGQATEHQDHRLGEHDRDRDADPGQQEAPRDPSFRMDTDRDRRQPDDRRGQDDQGSQERARRPSLGPARFEHDDAHRRVGQQERQEHDAEREHADRGLGAVAPALAPQ